MDFEDILLEVGDYGRYQKNLIWYFLMPASILLPWFTMNIFFMVSIPDHWCNVPELVLSNLSIEDQRALIGPPGEQCSMYNINFTDFLNNGSYVIPSNTSTRPCNQGWQYDQTYYDVTAATKWNMVCDDSHYNSFVLTMYNVGSILGTPFYGALSDKIGRKLTFFIIILVTAITALSSSLMTDFTAFIILKTLNGTLMPCVFQLPFIIILEIVGPEMRTRMNGFLNCAWTVGLSTLPLVAYLSRSWVTLGLVTSSVTVIFFLYWTFLPESPRWLVSQERYKEATKIMIQIAEKNGNKKDETAIMQKLQKLGEKLKKEKTVDKVQNSSLDLLRYPQLRKKFLIITTCWMANIMAYYGLQLNVANLYGNEFINFFLLSLVEFPGYLTSWMVMEKVGRRWCSVGGFLLTGIICMLPTIDLPYMDVICSMIGKFFAAGTFMTTYQQSSELYPTVVRSLGMGMSSTISSIATLIVPYLVYLSVYGKAIPFVIIGLSCILAGLLASFLPETLNENLPQSIFEAEDFGRTQKFFSYNRRRLSISRERAASIGHKIKSGDTVRKMDENDPRMQRSSQILQNIEMVAGIENALNISDSLKSLNRLGKRNSLDSRRETNVNYRNSSSENEKQYQVTSVPPTLENQETTDDNEKSSASEQHDTGKHKEANCPKSEDASFSYTNVVFEDGVTNDNVAKRDSQIKTDRVDVGNKNDDNGSENPPT